MYSRLGRNRNKRTKLSEINVTPMVDVMLVLLIVFMITTPMLVGGIDVDLPKSDHKPLQNNSEPLVISVNKNGQIYLLKTKIAKSNLINKLKQITKDKSNTQIYVKGDRHLSYGAILELVGYIQNAGFEKASLLTDNNIGNE